MLIGSSEYRSARTTGALTSLAVRLLALMQRSVSILASPDASDYVSDVLRVHIKTIYFCDGLHHLRWVELSVLESRGA